ncbi:MAG: hypothetical protein RR054_06440 [Clostridia bacterium]
MKLFKNMKVSMLYQPKETAIEKLSGILFEDEEVIGYFESSRAKLAFTSKRIIYIKGIDVPKARYYYSYRNVAAYGEKGNTLTLSLVNTPEYARFVLRIKDVKPTVNENNETTDVGIVAAEKLEELCRFLGNLIW